MKINIVLLTAVLFFTVAVHSVSNFAGIFTLINYSSTDNALGAIGTANIYNPSPLSIWSNPAKLGYYKGLSFGNTRIKWFDVPDIDHMYFNASYLSFGWNGIGIMIPSFNQGKKIGSTIDYGNQDIVDEDGNNLGSFEAFETSSNFAIGVNCLEFLSSMNGYPMSFEFQEISVGLSFEYIYSNLAPEETGNSEIASRGVGKSFTGDLGLIYRFSPLNKLNNNFIHLDLNSGITFLNPMQTKINYGSDSQEYSLPYGTNFGVSTKTMLKSNFLNLLGIDDSMIKLFIKDIFSITFVYDINQLGNFEVFGAEDKVYGSGYEISFLDIFSLRKGEYRDKMGHITGKTSGLGFNLNYQDIVQIQYNRSTTPAGELQKERKASDFMLKVDFLKLFNK